MVNYTSNKKGGMATPEVKVKICLFLFASLMVTMVMTPIFSQNTEAASGGLKVNVRTNGAGEVCVYSDNEDLGCEYASGGSTQFQFSEDAVDVGDQFTACFEGDCRSGTNGPEKAPETISFGSNPNSIYGNSPHTNKDNTYSRDNTESTDSFYKNVPSYKSNQNMGFSGICNTLQIALYNSCNELVNSDGSLSLLGQDTVKCIVSGAALGGIASTVIPAPLVLRGLDALSGPTGCGGLVKLDLLDSFGNIDGMIGTLKNLVP